ncbi:MAG: hypothetical protein PVF68_07400 [Acidobacteriota bacterium]|jgi:hypothetical protein
MLANKVVVRYLDGRVLKGVTCDFLPTRDSFHVADPADDRKITEVSTSDLKAVFFVRSFEGDPQHRKQAMPEGITRQPGRKLKVTFTDGEVICGTTNSYVPGRPSFFLVPVDPGGNNERAFVFAHATTSVEVVAAAPAAATR